MPVSSLRRILASRTNGARSQGPVTVEGKSHSSRNSTKHGLLADRIVLPGESPEDFETLLQDHIAEFEPEGAVELGMIEEMASAQWRLRRLWAIETCTFDAALAPETELDPDSVGPGDPLARIADAFRHLADTPTLILIHRYETRLHTIYQRAFRNLLVLRAARAPNEPNPISGHLTVSWVDHPSKPEPEAPSPSTPPESPAPPPARAPRENLPALPPPCPSPLHLREVLPALSNPAERVVALPAPIDKPPS